jgi:hypothetical protein
MIIHGKWNEEVKAVLAAEQEKDGFGTSDSDLLELLREADAVHTEPAGSQRWWDNILKVVKIGDHFIGFMDGRSPGDHSLCDLGWAFDCSKVHFCEPYEVTITKYRPLT